MATCTITGTLINAAEEAIEGATVQFIPNSTPLIDSSTGKAIVPRTIEETTDANGEFSVNIRVNMDVVVIIKAIGLKEVIRIPDEDTKNVFELIGGYVAGDPTPTDTGEDNW